MNNKIKILFANLGRWIDKHVIVPITKLALLIKKNLTRDSKKLEKLLSRKTSLLVITLVLAIAIFITVDSETIAMIETSAEILYNQPVEVQYNEEAYVLEGVPESVDITMIGRSFNVYLAKQISVHEVTLDLTGLKPGVHKVALKYKRAMDTINYKLDPSVVTITIYPKISEARTVNVDLLNTDDLDQKLVIEKTEIERDQVIIKGSEDTLKQVATIKALIDVNNFIDPKVGKLKLTDIPLIAYNQSGNVVEAEIVPSKISATITIASPHKSVPLRYVPVGTLSFGKAINTISSNINAVVIYGDYDIIDNISYIEVPVDVNGLKEDKQYSLTIKKPVGIKLISEVIANVNVTVEEEVTKEFSNIDVQYENLGDKYAVNAKTKDDGSIIIIVKGVRSVLDAINPANIRAYVDLKGYGVGEHEVDIKVEKTDLKVTYVPKVKKVTLVIKVKR